MTHKNFVIAISDHAAKDFAIEAGFDFRSLYIVRKAEALQGTIGGTIWVHESAAGRDDYRKVMEIATTRRMPVYRVGRFR